MNRIVSALFALSLALLGCALPPFSQTSSPAPAPGSLETVIAQTAAAAFTQTAQVVPATLTSTGTPLPTKTPTETPTPTATVIFVIPTFGQGQSSPTESSSSGGGTTAYACEITSHSPSNETEFDPQTKFDAKWTVKNTGTRTWTSNNMDYIYLSGNRIHVKSGYDLGRNVSVGESVELIVAMEAPRNSGTYATAWTLRIGNTEFCKMQLSIVVK